MGLPADAAASAFSALPRRVRVFCLPPAGAGASLYRRWNHISPALEIFPVQLPGREERLVEPSFRDAAALAAHIADQLRAEWRPPFVLFGHSMGALLCFELTRELRRRGQWGPALMVVSAFRAPHLPRRHPAWHALPEAELVAQVRRLGAVSQGIVDNAELRALVMPSLRTDFELCERYKSSPEEPLATPIVACGSRCDLLVTRDELAAWASCTTGAFRLHMIDGGHFAILEAPHELRRMLEEDLPFARPLFAATGSDAG